MRKTFILLAVSFFYTTFFLLWRGYSYGDGDHAEHLPFLFKRWNPLLYSGDYFLDYTDEARFNVRHGYVRLMSALADEETLPVVCFVLTFLFTWLGIAGAMAWGRASYPEAPLSGWLTPFFTHFLFYHYWSLGDNLIAENSFVSGTVSLAVGLWAMAFLMRGRLTLSAPLIALAGYMHIMLGLHLLVLAFIFVLLGGVRRRSLGLMGLIVLFVGVNFSFFMALAQDLTQQSVHCEGLKYGQFFLRFRLPHHFVMSTFPLTHYVKFAGLMAAMLVVAFAGAPLRGLRNWTAVTMSACGICLLYFVFTEIFNSDIAFKTQWPKVTIWLSAGASVILASRAEALWYQWRLRKFYAVVVPVFILLILAVQPILNHENVDHDWPWLRRQDALSDAHNFIRNHTSPDALFVTDPANDRFSIEARRPLLTGYRAVWADAGWACVWYKDFCRVYTVLPDSMKRGIKLRDLASCHFKKGLWSPQALNRKATHGLLPLEGLIFLPSCYHVLYKNDRYAVAALSCN